VISHINLKSLLLPAIFLLNINLLYAYDRVAASAYANKYWGYWDANDRANDNGNLGNGYNIFSSSDVNVNDYFDCNDNDCANFVSQCLIAGNLNGIGIGDVVNLTT
jgi:Putative amidase domain